MLWPSKIQNTFFPFWKMWLPLQFAPQATTWALISRLWGNHPLCKTFLCILQKARCASSTVMFHDRPFAAAWPPLSLISRRAFDHSKKDRDQSNPNYYRKRRKSRQKIWLLEWKIPPKNFLCLFHADGVKTDPNIGWLYGSSWVWRCWL